MRRFLGEILVELEAVTEVEVNQALKKQMDGDARRIGEILVEMGCTPENLSRALAEQFEHRFVDLELLDIPESVIQSVPREIATEHRIIPISVRDGIITIAMNDPLNLEVVDSLRFATSKQIEVAIASDRQIMAKLEKGWGISEDKLDQMLGELTESIEFHVGDDGNNTEDDAPVIRYVTQIIQEAINARASDIHIEPMADRLRIRYRIDGLCFAMDPAPKRLSGPVIQRLKIMAGMQVEERRRPQDGRIKAEIANKRIDLRVSCLPAIHGESVVMRILDQDNLKLSLNDMGFGAADYKLFKNIITRPNGIVLVTGPTGSGKTTTLYATLNELNTIDRKIITAEDPVEYHLNGVNQCQVRTKIGLDFPRILRSMLRQAPNIILVGEIRDVDTATIAINAALTGHLVFSTLHTNDAPSSISRLIDMGVPPFLVATSIQAVVAQRLIRTNCSNCAIPFTPEPRHLKALGITPQMIEGRTLKKGRGCDRCGDSGYKGRIGIFELMLMNNQIRNLAFEGGTTADIRKAAVSNGMNTLAMDGVRKILEGTTTPEEVLRVSKVEDAVA